MRIERGFRDSGLKAALEVLADDARLLVLGPVGSGRTMLLGDLAGHDLQHRRVWSCRGHRVGPPSGEPALWAGSIESLLDAVGGEPTTLLVDDADLLDGPALQRVLLLVERRHDLGLRIAAAHRPVRPGPDLAAADHALIGPLGALHLGPLTQDAIAAWTGDAHGAHSLHATTGGWPELVTAELAGSVPDLAGARMALLSTDHQRVVRAVCFGIRPDGDEADLAIAAAATVGLVHQGPTPQPAVAAAVRAAAPAADRSRIAAAAASAAPDVLVSVARHLLTAGDRSSDAAVLYVRAGDVLRATAPADSVDLYDAAAAAGRLAVGLGDRRARAALVAGRVEEAVSSPSTAGAAWAHLGRPDLAAGCYLDDESASVLAVLPLVGAGRLDDARASRAAAVSSDVDPAAVLADGALAWATGDAAGALDLFGRSARMAELTADVSGWPDSPHALAALSAVHCLDGERGETLARTAVDRAVGGGAYRVRHRLLEAWAALRAGRIDAAVEILDDVPARAGRDAMVASALKAAIAVRGDEAEGLPAIYREAVDSYKECQPDAFAPGLAADLAHLAARVGGDPSVVLAPLESLSRRLGDPPTIAVHLAWAQLLVAVATDDAPVARTVADVLVTIAGDSTRLLADAAVAFADVLDGVVVADAVKAVAARLVDRGLVFEASRLVGAAGLRSTDPVAARALLSDLRRLRITQVRRGGARPRAVAELSDREIEVARGVLEGCTHREIGARLFISAKTVEHHVARIRQKLGAGTKAELLSAIGDELME